MNSSALKMERPNKDEGFVKTEIDVGLEAAETVSHKADNDIEMKSNSNVDIRGTFGLKAIKYEDVTSNPINETGHEYCIEVKNTDCINRTKDSDALVLENENIKIKLEIEDSIEYNNM